MSLLGSFVYGGVCAEGEGSVAEFGVFVGSDEEDADAEGFFGWADADEDVGD